MKACLQSKPLTERFCRALSLAGASVAIEFVTVLPFEPRFVIQPNLEPPMNPVFKNDEIDFTCAGGMSSRTVSGGNPVGLSSTLKGPQLPNFGPYAQWAEAPDLLRIALNDAKYESDLFDASLRAVKQHGPGTANSMPELKMAEFSVQLPEASTVQLAADFTDWEKSPINLIRFEDGIWSTTVPLPPGNYVYRFLVDGEWYDDPRSLHRNSSNAVIQIK